jgi:hypothetical protein
VIYTASSTVANALNLKRIHFIKEKYSYNYDDNDIKYENTNTICIIIIVCFIAGTLGGIVGIAGGIILGPLFLMLGMHPTVVAATN